jgi:hypothetical protein
MATVRGLVAGMLALLVAASVAQPVRADAEGDAFLAACAKGKADDAKAKCKCVLDGIEKDFKDKKRAFAFQSVTMTAGDLANAPPSGLGEDDENTVTDRTFELMQSCGLVK